MNKHCFYLIPLLVLTSLLFSPANAQDPYAKLLELNKKSSDVEFYATDRTGGYVIVFDDFGYSFYNFSSEAAKSIRELNAEQKKIKSISFNPDGDWVIVHGKNGVHYSEIPADLEEELKEINKQELEIDFVTFTQTGGWLIVYDDYGYSYRGIPSDCIDKLAEVNQLKKPIKSVEFAKDGGWAILYGFNAYFAAGLPTDATDKLDELNGSRKELESIAFNELGEYVIIYDYNAFWCDLSDLSASPPVVVTEPSVTDPPIKTHPEPNQRPNYNQSPIAELNTDAVSDVKMYAVVVGVADYNHIKSLRFTDDDAYKFAMFLKSPEGGALSDKELKILVDEDATRANILTTMRSVYRQADANDVIVFYFSGHGQNGAFLPIDYDGRNNRLLHSDVTKVLKNSKAKHKICIADACHSGSLNRGTRDASTTDVIASFYKAWDKSSGGTALMMSSTAAEVSIEYAGIRQGVFSYYLIKGLKGDADADHNRIVTIRELFAYTSKNVKSYTRNRQNPVLSGNFDNKMPIGIVR